MTAWVMQQDPPDAARLLLTVLAAAWGLAFAYAFVSFAITPPNDMGFTRGLNRIEAFLGWQGVAGVLAIAIFAIGRRWPVGTSIRKLSMVPLILLALLVSAIAVIILWAVLAA